MKEDIPFYLKKSRKKRLQKKKRICFLTFLVIVLSVLGITIKSSLPPGGGILQRNDLPVAQSQSSAPARRYLDNIYSTSAILADASNGHVLAEREPDQRIFPASLTKIMTAIIAIESVPDLNQTITLQQEFFAGLYEQEAAMAGFQPGEQVKMIDLIYGILLPSGAECCTAVENLIAGSEEQFAALMNEKAAEIGMNDTHFCNATGLHDENHYSTVKDIALLLRYALQNNIFRTAFTAESYNVQPTNIHTNGFTLQSNLFKNLESSNVTGGNILGGKTGYTEQAGLCLASLAVIHQREYLLVTVHAEPSSSEPVHILDAVNIYEQVSLYKQ